MNFALVSRKNVDVNFGQKQFNSFYVNMYFHHSIFVIDLHQGFTFCGTYWIEQDWVA